ncbi:Hypothetical predicted protein, partial [Mytilus galloprovincialis]
IKNRLSEEADETKHESSTEEVIKDDIMKGKKPEVKWYHSVVQEEPIDNNKHHTDHLPTTANCEESILENKFRGDAEYLFTSSIHNVFNAVPGFPDNEVLPTLDSQRHWATKVRARPLATRVGAAFLPIYNPKQTQAPVRAVALQPTRPIQTKAPVRAAAPLVQTKAPVRVSG